MTEAKATYFGEHENVLRGGKRYLTKRQTAFRYGCSASTIDRWGARPELGFPRGLSVVAGGPVLYAESDLDEYDARRAAEAARKPKKAADPALTAAYAGDSDTAPPATAGRHLPASHKPIGRPGAGPARLTRPV